MFALTGCQPKTDASKNADTADIPLIQAKVVAVKIPKQKVCLEDGCTHYDLQTVETNQQWIELFRINSTSVDGQAQAGTEFRIGG